MAANLDLIRGRQQVSPLTNKSGGERAEGEVVVVDETTDDSFTRTTSEGKKEVLGVVAETIADDAEGRVICSGYVPVLEVDGATARGDFLKTSTTAGKATPTANPEAGSFAIALSTTGGAGQVSAFIFAGPFGGTVAHAADHQDGGGDEISVAALSGELTDPQPPKTHKASHEDTGGDEISVQGLAGLLLADQHVLDAEVLAVAAALVHKDRHKSGGADELTATDLLEAIVKRIQTSTGPTTLTVGAIAIGEYLKRDGATLIGGMPAGGASGEGHITILPFNYNSIGQGTWEFLLTADVILYTLFYNTSHDDGDNISYKVYLDAGTYTLRTIGRTHPAYGIMDIDIDAVEVASFDLYSDPAVDNVVSTEAGIVIAAAGLKALKVRVDGKNGSSSDHYVSYSYIALWRTA